MFACSLIEKQLVERENVVLKKKEKKKRKGAVMVIFGAVNKVVDVSFLKKKKS